MASNCSYGEHSSSSEDRPPSERWLGEDHYGFIEFCKCGSHMFMARETSPTHRGRIYLKCSNFRAAGEHCSKWFDEVIDEEIKNIKLVAKNHTEELDKLRQRLNNSTEPFSTRFSHEVTKLNISISNLQRELEQVDRKYAHLCNVPGFYESRRGWLKYAYARLGFDPASTAKQTGQTTKSAMVVALVVGISVAIFALYRSQTTWTFGR